MGKRPCFREKLRECRSILPEITKLDTHSEKYGLVQSFPKSKGFKHIILTKKLWLMNILGILLMKLDATLD
ncbi:MAG: hypothetical protein Q9M75_10505, partial [Ghiorsea sp.]|nr:hypothetical protein [Ghiorsea sp.]